MLMSRMLGWILFGLLVGSAAAALAVTVTEFICRSNLADIVRRELCNAPNEVARRMLGRTVRAKIKSKGVNVVSLDAIDEDTGDIIEIRVTSEAGVDDFIRVDDVISICG